MTQSTEQERAEFEAWASDRGYDVKRGPNGDYLYRDAVVAHRAWQAARRAQAAPTVQAVEPCRICFETEPHSGTCGSSARSSGSP